MKKIISILLVCLMVIPFGIFSVTGVTAEEVESTPIKTVYLSDNGIGDGTTPEAPLANLTDAYNALGSNGGNIVVVGTYSQRGNFFAPSHSGKVTISGYDSSAVYSIAASGRFFLGGETEITGIAINAVGSATWMPVCLFNNFTISDTVTVKRTGSFVIVLGGQGDSSANGSDYTVKDTVLTINGGDWDYVYGSVRTNLQVPGGVKSANDFRNYDLTMNVGGNAVIKRLYTFTGEAACHMIATNSTCTVNLNGGKITYFMGAHPFKTVTSGYGDGVTVNIGKDFVLSDSFNLDTTVTAENRVNSGGTYCGLSAECAYGDNVITNTQPPLNDTLIIADEIYESVINDKKLRLSQFETVMKASEVEEEEEIVIGDGVENGMIYVKEGSNGTGASADNAIGDFYTAIEYAATLENDATVVICGEVNFDISASYHEKEHSNTITWTSFDSSSCLKIKTGSGQAFYMNGKMTLDDITLKITTQYILQLVTQYYDFKVEDNVVFLNSNGTNHYATVRCNISTTSIGYDEEAGVINKDAYISLKSGTYENVCYFNTKGLANSIGTFNCYVGGTASIKNIAPNRGGTITVANTNITLDGGSILRFVCGSDQLLPTFDTYDQIGVSGTFNLTVTKNFDITKSFTLATPSTTTHFGISGVTCALVGDADLLDRAEYNLTIDSEVFWGVREWIQDNTFDTITVNGDIPQEPVTNSYVTRMVRHLAGWDVDYFVQSDADRNDDGKVNNRDVIYCIQELAGWYNED